MFEFNNLLLSRKNFLFTVFILFLVAFFAVGGCNDSNNGNGDSDPGPDLGASACEALTDPCSSISKITGSTDYVECVLDVSACAVDLDNVLTQMQNNGGNVSESSILWIEAWGGDGGSAAENGGGNSAGGYAQYTSSVSDIKNTYNGTGELFYFLGEHGGNAPGHCGGGGGAATIVTIEDLTLNPDANPTGSLVLMIAGGGGGASGGTIKGCTVPDGVGGKGGGIAISGTGGDASGAGAGCNTDTNGCIGAGTCTSDCVGFAEGGGTSGNTGGLYVCCNDKNVEPTSGNSGFGGRGGLGGQGVNCTGVLTSGFRNTGSIDLTFSAGRGGSGGGDSSTCITGGGAGGGGYGGGGGGSHGQDSRTAVAGGGGGSYSVSSTQTASIAPSSDPGNPCGSVGCIVINVIED